MYIVFNRSQLTVSGVWNSHARLVGLGTFCRRTCRFYKGTCLQTSESRRNEIYYSISLLVYGVLADPGSFNYVIDPDYLAIWLVFPCFHESFMNHFVW